MYDWTRLAKFSEVYYPFKQFYPSLAISSLDGPSLDKFVSLSAMVRQFSLDEQRLAKCDQV